MSETQSTTQATNQIAQQIAQAAQPTTEMAEVGRQIMNLCTKLIIKLAKCKCQHRDTCDVYNVAQEIADAIEKMLELSRRG